MYDFRQWRHVFKLDPNKKISDEHLERLCESNTDAVIVGGTDGVTLDNVLELMSRIRKYTVPCVLEVSNIEAITPGFDLYFIPTVLNSQDPRWIIELHHQAIKEYGHMVNWDETFVQGYCIMNEECKAAKLTKAKGSLSIEDVEAYAVICEKIFRLPIFYLEYSGAYGDPKVAAAVKNNLKETVFFYGGGIESVEQAEEMSQFADCIVVGNAIYTNFEEALKTANIRSGKF